MTSLTSDQACFFKRHPDGALSGLLGAYVDDCFIAGDEAFQTKTKAMLECFDGKERVWDEAEFVGFRASTVKGDKPHCTLGQLEYVDNVKSLAPDATFSQFASARASLAWLGHTRPDLCCRINQVAQVSESVFDAAAIKTLNGLVKHTKARRELVLRYPKLDRSTLHLRVYPDSSFANNRD
eukprot:contig_1145_g150